MDGFELPGFSVGLKRSRGKKEAVKEKSVYSFCNINHNRNLLVLQMLHNITHL